MQEEELQSLVDMGLSQREIAAKTGKAQTTIRYWLAKFGIKTNKRLQGKFHCSRCGETDRDKFYGNKGSICGDCHNKYTIASGKTKREYALSKLGERCMYCGYDEYMCSLDIHHLDPTIKDRNFSSFRGWSFKRIDKELESCVLLCKNCHTALHCNHITLSL